jgi:hypothetical protein
MQPQIPASGLPFPTVPEVIFANWREALHVSGLTPGMQSVYALALSGYLETGNGRGVWPSSSAPATSNPLRARISSPF